ncbi:hypothetical protein GSC54_003243 [Salmonella enterica]|nr:hypothetical protein [Salmonella enterica]ELT1238482.1 hypothetical protein [Salmonella enterica]
MNMLATPKEILNSSGYLRSFPGITKRYDMNGVSRGVEYWRTFRLHHRLRAGIANCDRQY